MRRIVSQSAWSSSASFAFLVALASCTGSDDLPRTPISALNGSGANAGGSTGTGGSATKEGGSAGTTSQSGATVGTGSFTLVVDPSGSFVLNGPSGTRLTFPLDAFQLGTVTAVSDDENYDPYPLFAGTTTKAPDGLTWVSPRFAAVESHDTLTATITLTYSASLTATVLLSFASDGRFKATWTPSGGEVAYFRLRPRGSSTEAFYGLGESFDDVNQRGKIRPMQLEIDAKAEQGYTPTHVPIPFVIGTTGWGLFVESPYPGAFLVASSEDDLVEAVFGHGVASSSGITFHIYGAERALDITKHYYEDTGFPRIPAPWALGPWLWRDENTSQDQVEADLNAMRDLDLPHTAIWIDRPYATGVNTFDFNQTTDNAPKFPDPQHMIDLAHALGFRVALWHTPYEDEKDPHTAPLVSELESNGYYPPIAGINLNAWGRLVDFTNPGAYNYWQQHLFHYSQMGIEGYKLDYGEDVVPGLPGIRDVWKFHDGSDERTMHSRFSLLYHRVYQETLPSTGGFLLCRHGSYGDQAYVDVIWPGDLDATFAKAGEKAMDGSSKPYVSVGGLPAAVVAGMSLGPSGFPFYASDTGGYIHSPPDKELFTRWFEYAALGTAMEVGNGASTVAWEPDMTTGYDQEMLDWYRGFVRLHVRLFPYVWTYAQNLATDGRAIQRPLGLAYPELGQHPNDEFLLGDNLLVAPVLERGATSRDVAFPAGRWIDFFDGTIHEGPETETVDAPLAKLPLYIREGGIVPLLRPTIDAIAPTTEADRVDSYATTPGVLYPRIFPSATTSSFTLYDGTSITQSRSGSDIAIDVSPGSAFTFGQHIDVLNVPGPTAVTSDGTPLTQATSQADLDSMAAGWLFDPSTGGHVFVKVGSGSHHIVVKGS